MATSEEPTDAETFAKEVRNVAHKVTVEESSFGGKTVEVLAENGEEIAAVEELAEGTDARYTSENNHAVRGVFETAGRSFTRMAFFF